MNAATNFNQMLAMRVFVRVVEAGTFTSAADSLRMPKPTVTKLVQGLENHLRIRLLNRTTRRVTVTPDGSAYYERVVRLLGDLEDIESSVTHAKEKPRGRLRIDAGAAVTTYIVLPALPEFVARYPDIAVECGVSDRPADLIGDNVDCVIRAGPLLEPSLIARHIGDLRWMTCATHAYFATHPRPTHPTDLESGHTLAGYFFPRSGRMRPLVFERDGRRIEISPSPRVAVNDSAAHFASLRAGLGLGQLISFMVSASGANAELVPVLQDWQPAPLPVHVLYPANRHLSTKVRVFVDWIAEVFSRSACTRLAEVRP
ncbi:MAG TPA: LysR family transcriptional regulator [Steroidobacteraceae bacterium]|nr:LysR family transcriptional regulator [Steroidobacteraceae bacterium]